MTGVTRPFPWNALERVRASDLDRVDRVRSAARRFLDQHDWRQIAEELAGAPIDIKLRRFTTSSAEARTHGAWVLARDRATGASFVLFVDPALAAEIASAATANADRRPVAVAENVPKSVAGAFAAMVAAWARRIDHDAELEVRAFGSAPLPIELDASVCASFVVLVGDEAYSAEVFVTGGRAPPSEPFGAAGLETLDQLAVPLRLVASVSWASTREVTSLGVGDAWMPAGWSLAAAAAGWIGDAFLGSARSTSVIGVRLDDGGRLALTGAVERLDVMSSEMESSELVEVLGEAPIAIRVELGTISLPASDWAKLARGDVIATSTKIAEPVVLRAGGVIIARGELVDVDGEVGVRILERVR